MSSSTSTHWIFLLLLRCGDVESNPGPAASAVTLDESEAPTTVAMHTSPSRISLASIRSTIQKRRRELHIERTPLWNSCRLLLAAMGFLGFINVYAMRVNLSVAMVCMINHTATSITTDTTPNDNNDFLSRLASNLSTGEVNGNVTMPADVVTATASTTSGNSTQTVVDSESSRCGAQSLNASLSNKEDGEFTWDKEIQGLVLGSFFWGYMTTQIAGGWLSNRFGGKRVYGFFMLGCSICTLLMPLAARIDYRFLIVLRFLAGVGQGVTFPAMNVLWANWAPPLESSKLGSFSYSGSQLGNVITFPLTGILCEYGFDGGWPCIFYLLGCLGILWFVAWTFLVYDSPAEHPRISPEEKQYITTSLKGKMSASRQAQSHVPVHTIMTSRPVWGIIITHTCSNFGTYAFLTNIPTYMKEVLHFDIKQNGLLSALPYIGFWMAIVVSGQLADVVRSHGLLTTTHTRKIGNSIGMLMPGIFVAAVGYLTCEQSTTAVALLTVGVAMSGFQYGGGFLVNPVDIAPKYAGVIFGISNTFATIPGFVAPLVIGLITTHQTQAEWQIVFFIATGIYTVGAVAYILLGSGELQSWARQAHDPEQGDKLTRGLEGDAAAAEPLLSDDVAKSNDMTTGTKPGKSLVSFNLPSNEGKGVENFSEDDVQSLGDAEDRVGEITPLGSGGEGKNDDVVEGKDGVVSDGREEKEPSVNFY